MPFSLPIFVRQRNPRTTPTKSTINIACAKTGGGAYFAFFLRFRRLAHHPPPKKPPDEEGLLWGFPLSVLVVHQSELTEFFFVEFTEFAQNSVSSLFRNSTLETVFCPFPILRRTLPRTPFHLQMSLQAYPVLVSFFFPIFFILPWKTHQKTRIDSYRNPKITGKKGNCSKKTINSS